MSIAAIIYLVLVGLTWLVTAYMHGKPKKEKYNFFTTMINSLIILGILYWGGFFN